MIALNHISLVTDLLRKDNEPLVKEPVKDLCTDYADYRMTAIIRYMGIKSQHPTAQWIEDGSIFSVFVEGLEVYRKELIYIDPEFMEVEDEYETGEEK